MKFGVFTVMMPDLSVEDGAQALRDSGYDGVEWRVKAIPADQRNEAPSFWGNNLCTLAPTKADAIRGREIAESAGLAIPGLGTYIDVGDVAAAENAMQMAQACGANQIRVSPGSWPSGRSYADAFQCARNFLKQVEQLARRYNIKALVEIHHNTITPSASLAHRLVTGFDPAYIGVLHDVGNMVYEGYENYRIGLDLLGPYLAHVHVKNAIYQAPDENGVCHATWSPLEEGVVDFQALFTALRGVGYDGWVCVEDFSQARPTVDALAHNIAFLKSIVEPVYS